MEIRDISTRDSFVKVDHRILNIVHFRSWCFITILFLKGISTD